MIVIINATAAKSSGALTIVRDFISYLQQNSNSNYTFHLFTSVEEFTDSELINVHKITFTGWINRMKWDNGGLYKWCQTNNIYPDVIISLQNTSTKWSALNPIPQLVYYHQPLPLIDYKFNFLSKSEIKLLLYQKFYLFFVKKHNKHTTYIVQLPYIKELLSKKLKLKSDKHIFVVTPNIPVLSKLKLDITYSKFTFIYPGTPLRYKNHKILIDAIVLLKKMNSQILDHIQILFTIQKLPKRMQVLIDKYQLDSVIQCIGFIPYQELISIYQISDALLFPSQIESYGLPLIEAAAFGLPIIASDLPYAREVLPDYSNIMFADPENPSAWANLISQFDKLKKSKPLKRDTVNAWKATMQIVDSLINS